VQDAAYGTLLREPRRTLHARIAEVLENQFAEIAKSQPELLAHHCTEAGLIEKAATLLGKAGQRSLERSALVEAVAHLTRALSQIGALPGTAALRREQIKFQVALANALMHTKGYASSETRASLDQTRSLIEQAEAMGEPPEDPLLLFSILFGFFIANFVAFNGDAAREAAVQFLRLAEKQGTTIPLMIGHRLMGASLLLTGHLAESRAHYDQAIALYNPAEHRPLTMRFGQDVGVTILSYRSWALWLLGCPDAARADAKHEVEDARDIEQAATLMYALSHAPWTLIWCGNYAEATAQTKEVIVLADEKGSLYWKAFGTMNLGCLFALTGKGSHAVQMITSGIAALRSTGANLWMPLYLPHLARAHAELGQFEEAWRSIADAMTAVETQKERWCEADVHRTAGAITLMSHEPDVTKAEMHFERALAIARQQRAKSWELRAAMSMARLWRDQGRGQRAYNLLGPVYGSFTEGFDTLDLTEAKTLLDELT
jgi:predicted ATPase